jgi:malonyl-CoA O-methyltransferase
MGLFSRSRPARLLPSRQAYALWAGNYPPVPHNRLMEIEQEAMLRLMPPLAGRDVLDLACGTGRYGQIALRAGARRVIGADNSLPMLRAGGDGAGGPVTQIEGSMTALPFAARSFDIVLCGLAIGHLPPESMRAAVIEVGRVLRPGGEALISDFHPYLTLTGGQRAFTGQDGKRYAIEQYVYVVSDYFAALGDATMILSGIEEPRTELNGQMVPACLALRCKRI